MELNSSVERLMKDWGNRGAVIWHFSMSNTMVSCREYHLLALGGLLTAPPKMVIAATDFVVGSYAQLVLKQLEFGLAMEDIKVDSHIERQQYNEIKRILTTYTSWLHNTNFVKLPGLTAFVPFRLDGWTNPFGDNQATLQALQHQERRGINVILKVVGEVGENRALWLYGSWTMQIYVVLPEMQALSDFLQLAHQLPAMVEDITDSVEHELIHMVQGIGTVVKKMPRDLAGLPSKEVRSPKYKPSGQPRQDQNPEAAPERWNLRDVEFYTQLNDVVKAYQRLIKQVPEMLKDEFMRVFLAAQSHVENIKAYPKAIRDKIYYNEYMLALKRLDIKRWELAVKRLVPILSVL